VDWQPGDFAVVHIPELAGTMVHVMQQISGGHGHYEHAIQGVDGGMIVEATPEGAVLLPMHYPAEHVAWSTGHVDVTAGQRELIVAAARSYVGTPYSFLDYAAIAAHCWHLWAPGLKSYVASTRHQICSQLVDACQQAGGVQLFADHRWNGFVRPDDLAGRIGAVPHWQAA
jgi:uncharacterized protein YycO